MPPKELFEEKIIFTPKPDDITGFDGSCNYIHIGIYTQRWAQECERAGTLAL